MSIITENISNDNKIIESISSFFKRFSVGSILRKSNACKLYGVPITHIFMYLVQLVFTRKSMYMNMLLSPEGSGFGKDVVYRLLNSSFINWTKYLLMLASQVINSAIEPLVSENRKSAIIFDDTFYGRERSKKVELLANVHDHSSKGKKFKRGFAMLTAIWSDGATSIPLMFRHMSSTEAKNRYNEINANIDKRSNGYKARKQAISGKIVVMMEMLVQIKKIGIKAKHVLFDSWFSFPVTLIEISKMGFMAVARLKKTRTIKYVYEGDKKTVSEIFSSAKKRRGRSRYLLSVEVLLYNDSDELIPARIVYVRNRNKRNDWIALISTDMSLGEDEVIALYGKRWDIEVFFKITKTYLSLGKEFQGISYDSITAHTAIVMTRFIMLALEKRQNEDDRTMGPLFFLLCDEIADIGFAKALELILSLLCDVLEEVLFLSQEDITVLIDAFVEKLPFHLKRLLSTMACV